MELEASDRIVCIKYYRIWATDLTKSTEKYYITAACCPIHYYSCSLMSENVPVNYEICDEISGACMALFPIRATCFIRDKALLQFFYSPRFEEHGMCCV